MGPTRKETVRIEHRRMRVEELRLEGWTQAAIAGELGVSQPTISSDIKANRQDCRESQIRDSEERLEELIKMLELVEREARDAWERTQQPAETIRITQKNGEKTVAKTVRQRQGDPRFLRIAQRAGDTRCKLQGLDAAVPDEQNQELIDREVHRRYMIVYERMIYDPSPKPYVNDAYIEQLVISLGPTPPANSKPARAAPALPQTLI